ncbi:MAG: flagellar motor switch protein FliN [Dehalococcoidia bacterium]
MSEPQEVLSQLLSPAQATTLSATGGETWKTAAAALEAFQGAAPLFSEIEASLVMPDEITGKFSDPHIAIPLELSTDQDQAATAYLAVPTPVAAMFLDSQADNPEDEEQQTIVMASTLLGQVIQALNTQVFGKSSAGLVVAIDDLTANTMAETLAAMDDPCMLLTGTLGGAKVLPISLVLPGTFLDIMAGAMEGAVGAPAASAPAAPSAAEPTSEPAAFSFELTQDELEAAELLEIADEPEPVLASVGGGREAAPEPPPSRREPTPIGPAASRARFAPLPEQPEPAQRSSIDLLAGLQMNVTVELGRTELTVSEVLGLGPGSVIELDRLAGEPVDILVNDRLIARGEVVVVDENFGVRVVEVIRRGNDEERDR